MKISITYLCFLFLIPAISFGQKRNFQATAGITGNVFHNKPGYSGSYGITWAPRYNFIGKQTDFSVSVCTPLSIAFHPALENNPNNFLHTQIPVTCEVNMGHYASRDFRTLAGAFLGGGYALQTEGLTFANGPIAAGGVRFWITKRKSATIRLSHFFAVSKKGHDVSSVTIGFNMGSYLRDIYQKNVISDFMSPVKKGKK